MPELQNLTPYERDSLTLECLDRAEQALQEALRAMPNHVDSLFDPAWDAKRVSDACRDLQLISSGVRNARAHAQVEA